MWYIVAWALNIPHRYRKWREDMISKREHQELSDRIVHQRAMEMLQALLVEGVIEEYEIPRYKAKFEYLLPTPVDHTHFIDLVSQLQQKRGDEREKKKWTAG